MGTALLMMLAIPSWWSWCCSFPVCLHGFCCRAIPARERQREHGWGSTDQSTPAPSQAAARLCGVGRAGGHLLEHTDLGCS